MAQAAASSLDPRLRIKLRAAASMEDVRKKVNGSGGRVQFFLVATVLLYVLLYAPRVFVNIVPYRATDFIVSAAGEDYKQQQQVSVDLDNQVWSPCSTMRNDSICCDRSDANSDVCFMAGDVRTDAKSLSLLLFPPPSDHHHHHQEEDEEEEDHEERVRPYTRKWERYIMGKIQEVRLRRARRPDTRRHRCDVRHDAPVLVMTAGGYTGNFFHTFNDGFLPAWLTAQHLRRRVVLGVLSYKRWWAGTFSRIISGLSRYDVVDLVNDRRTHCFPGAIVGTRFHGMLAVDPARLRDNKTILDFNRFLAHVFDTKTIIPSGGGRPRLGILSRNGTRVIENQADVAELARSVGFDVDIIETASGTPLPAVYAAVSACDALVGVHGADLTKFLFLRPGHASLTQIAPLGVPSIGRSWFGEPAARMGLRYEQYEVRPHESSLSRRYAPGDVVVADPDKAKLVNPGWTFMKQVYLQGQNVTLDLPRFRETLARMHAHAVSSRQR